MSYCPLHHHYIIPSGDITSYLAVSLSITSQFIRECEARLVEDYKVDYLYTHVRAMVQEEQKRDLSNLFILLSGIPRALDPVVTEFEEHVKSQGRLT